MTEYSGEEVASLVGDDLAARLALDDGPYTDADLDALTDALAEGAALADRVADGDVAALATLFSPDFVRAHSEFDSFADFLGASPWTRSDVEDAFAGRRDAADVDPAAATTSSFLARTTAFRTPGEMVQSAVVYRCRKALDEHAQSTNDEAEADGEAAGKDVNEDA